MSRVSPPAQSTGFALLQRGGSLPSIWALRSSGSSNSFKSPSRAKASEVTTPHPPAVVIITTLGPFGSGCVAKVAAASKASSTVSARVIPAARQKPSKTLSLAANAPVCEAAACAPLSVAPPFTRTNGLRAATPARRVINERPSLIPSR
ncbi:unannotated protein [freshwater metagenome]|uniref:Unannotated protein n=1 Tax=freshwater metagenome TaxID=449393 RepID=A0A6J6IPG6_9ZZZZ